MNNKIKERLLLCLLVFFLFGCSFPVSKEQVSTFTFLNNKVLSWIDSGYYQGAAMKIVQQDKILFESMYGQYTDTTVLHVASAGKWIVAATIASLVDEGLLSWGDSVNKYLPEFTGSKGHATLRQLLSHTAGYPDYQPENKKRDDYQTLEEAISHILPLPADTLPGTKFRYGGLAMQMAGRMAEVATGKDWETLFQEKIAIPLQMNHSHFTPVSQEPGFNPMLGGGFYTCLRDYMFFLEMIMNKGEFRGKQILFEDAVREIEADQVKQAMVNQPEYVLNSRQNSHTSIYGLGCWREEIDKEGNATLISSPGWAGSYPWVDRKNNVYGFILAKVNVEKANKEGFSSFYGSAVLPLIIRDALNKADSIRRY